jgi:hypothetical protein
MRKLMLGVVLALALPAAAAALAQDGAVSPEALATKACKTERTEMGAKTFKATYAAKSMAKAKKACLAKNGVTAEDAVHNAAQECRAERDADPATFGQNYEGVNVNGRNAFGKCVSTKAKAQSEEATDDRVEAADTCKGLKKDAEAFKAEFGDKKNAFGKCVSKTAKALAEAAEETEQTQA